MVGEDEHGRVERRDVAPPPLPLVVLPRAAVGAELVGAHDLGADVPVELADHVVVEALGAAGLRAVGPAVGGEGPRAEDGRIGVAEGTLEALALAGAKAGLGEHEVVDAQELGHRQASGSGEARPSSA